jgi:hypothetical protein
MTSRSARIQERFFGDKAAYFLRDRRCRMLDWFHSGTGDVRRQSHWEASSQSRRRLDGEGSGPQRT